MVRDINDITINDYDLVERTGRISHFKKRYNFLPTKFFEGKITNILNEILVLFAGNEDDLLEDKY